MSQQDIKHELPKGYIPKDVERSVYSTWEASGYFNPDNLPGERSEGFSVMFPPPNVTGVLHLGHAMENTIMDIVVRCQRMRGKKALLLPGTDHAAVATQARVEKNLVDSGNYTNPRGELGREKLLEKIRAYAEKSKSTILSQIRMMGTSCDWSRLAYTFDDTRSDAVNAIFSKMYEDELIYRGERIINWDPMIQSTVSDDEIVRVEKQEPFYYFQYGPFVIATSRPETKFGDKYVVMHPDDERYKQYNHGDTFECEWINGTITATVIKDPAIDMEFGTGVMTITPWHDHVDFEIAERHNLDKEQIIDWDGTLLSIAGEFAGMSILEARPRIVEKLKGKGLLVDIDEEYAHAVAMGDRSKGLLEPQIKAQWFVDVNKGISGRGKSLKDLMRDAVTTGHGNDASQKIIIQPEYFTKVYLHWIDNLHDWCISRQIWWGHRIPAYYRKQGNSEFRIQNSELKRDNIYVGTNPPEDGEWEQDPDTLDTWFSSGMWTFSTLGWSSFAEASDDTPTKTGDIATYHPSSWMQMGHEILFLWMARMILMSTYALDEIPFREVYIHGMLRDKDGRKFSKSLDNGIDPLEIIGRYGTDALRMSLVAGIAPGNDSRFSEEKVDHYRKFVNKVWNVSRFIMMRCSDRPSTDSLLSKEEEWTFADKWIMSRLHSVTREVNGHLDAYRFSQAAELIYEFIWHELADWYLEISKAENNKEPMLVLVLTHTLTLLHPFAPFVTEYIWSLLIEGEFLPSVLNPQSLLMIQKWPEVDESKVDENIEKEFASFKEVVTKIRNYKSSSGIKMKEEIDVHESLGVDLNNELKDLVQTMVHVRLSSNGLLVV